jgi:hypothetical protein
MILREYKLLCLMSRRFHYLRLTTERVQRFARCPCCGGDSPIYLMPPVGER